MVALVHVPAGFRFERIHRVEREHLDAGIGEALEEFLLRAEGADAVVDQADLHARALLRDQCVGETMARLVVLEDVGLHVDVVARGLDRGEHRLVGARAVFEQHDLVAG